MKYLFSLALFLLLLGCQTTQEETIEVTKVEAVSIFNENIIADNEIKLTVVSNPQNARIRIMNIKPKYQDGIILKKGSYDIEVTSPGHETYRKWVQLSEATTLNVNLSKQDVTNL